MHMNKGNTVKRSELTTTVTDFLGPSPRLPKPGCFSGGLQVRYFDSRYFI